MEANKTSKQETQRVHEKILARANYCECQLWTPGIQRKSRAGNGNVSASKRLRWTSLHDRDESGPRQTTHSLHLHTRAERRDVFNQIHLHTINILSLYMFMSWLGFNFSRSDTTDVSESLYLKNICLNLLMSPAVHLIQPAKTAFYQLQSCRNSHQRMKIITRPQ